MTTAGIRKTIATALSHERETGAFRSLQTRQLPTLQEKLLLPDHEPMAALMDFVVNYIESVPGSLDLVTAVSKQQGFYDYAAPFLHMAEDYFLRPPDVLPDDESLEAVLDEAFLAHRLLEEVNDHHIRHLQRPLLPLDMTEANLVVHYLLGDELATRLEHLVQFAASHHLEKDYVWERVRNLPGAEQNPSLVISSSSLTQPDQVIKLRLAY